MSTFQFPYTSRIMGRLPGHEPIELYRPCVAGKDMEPPEVRSVTANLAPEWTWWIERVTPATHIIGGRRIPTHLHKQTDPTSNGRGGIRLTFTEIQRLEGDRPRLTHWT